MINLKTTANSGRSLARRGLLGLLSSAAMALAFHGVASAADVPPIPNDAPPITKAPPPAGPLPGHYKIGEMDLTVSGVATLGTAVRTTGRNAILIPPQNGRLIGVPGQAVGGANADDGNLNWDSGKPVSTVAKAFVTIDANYRENVGVFLRGMAWYDYTLATQDVPWGNTSGGYLSGNPLSQNGWDPRARSFGIAPQEAYAYVKQRVGDAAFEGRVGDILVPWGLPTMIPGGFVTAMNAVDYAALNRPGVQPEEILAPTPGAWARVALFDRATLEAFSLFTAPRSTLPGCGTLYTAADWVAPGCNNVVFGANADPVALATGFAIGRDPTPTNQDAQFGVGGSYIFKEIGTKFGAYYSHVDYSIPTAAVVTSTRVAPLFIPNAPGNPLYFETYAAGVDSFALNFTTQVKGTTVYGEYVYTSRTRRSSITPRMFSTPCCPPPRRRSCVRSMLPRLPVRSSTLTTVCKSATWCLAAGRSYPECSEPRRLCSAASSARSRSTICRTRVSVATAALTSSDLARSRAFPNGGCTAATPAYQCSLDGYVSPLAMGYRLTSSLQYENVFMPGMTVTPTIGLSHGRQGLVL